MTFAANIKETGVGGAYTTEFNDMEAVNNQVQEILNSTKLSTSGIDEVENKIR